MPIGSSVLLEKVEHLEHKGLRKNKALLSRIPATENLLENIYSSRCPKSHDYADRRDLIHIYNLIAKEICGKQECPVVEEFGSFVMNIFSSESDLDLSINLRHDATNLSRGAKINMLRKFVKKFYALQRQGHVKNIQSVFTARVPVVKVTDCGTGIECDFSVENRDGIAKSHIISFITAIDERFLRLSVVLKAWAKAQGINSSKDGTLNSLSLISLAAFHLQCQDPPILPPFSTIFKDGLDLANVKRNVESFLNYGHRNQESVVKLFATLLVRLKSVKALWVEGLCASIFEGSWIYKTFADRNKNICIEDFTDRSQNVARAVGSTQVIEIYGRIENSLGLIKSFINGRIEGNELRRLLFGPDPPTEIRYETNRKITLFKPDIVAPTPKKKARINGGKGGEASSSFQGRGPANDQSKKYMVERNGRDHVSLRSEQNFRSGDVGVRRGGQMNDRHVDMPCERRYEPQHSQSFFQQGAGEGPIRYGVTYDTDLRERPETSRSYLGNFSLGASGLAFLSQRAGEGPIRYRGTYDKDLIERPEKSRSYMGNFSLGASGLALSSHVHDGNSLIGRGVPRHLPDHSSMLYPGRELGSHVLYFPGPVYSSHVQSNTPRPMPRGPNPPHYW